MPTLRANIRLEVDGKVAAGFPVAISQSVVAVQQFVAPKEATDDDRSLPIESITRVKALVARLGSQGLTVRLNGLASGGVPLNGLGALVILGSDLNAGAAANARVLNEGDETATAIGFAAGLH